MDYREVLTEEIKAVVKLHNELAYFIQKETGDVYWDFDKLSEEETYAYLLSFIQGSECKICIACEDEKIIGFIMGEKVSCHLPISSIKKIGYISAAYVIPEYRNKGVMKELENRMINFFKESGIKYCEVNFLTYNAVAKTSWSAMGYQTFREQARKEIR